MKGRIVGALLAEVSGLGCATLVWLTLAVQEGNTALAIIGIITMLTIIGALFVSLKIGEIQKRTIGRATYNVILTELLPGRAFVIGIPVGVLVGGLVVGFTGIYKASCGAATAVLAGAVVLAILGATLGTPEEAPRRRIGTFSHLTNQALLYELVGNILARDFGYDVEECEALKEEIIARLQRLKLPLNLLLTLLQHEDWAVRDAIALILGHSNDIRAVKPLIGTMMKDESQSVQHTASLALKRIGTAEALAAVETWWCLEEGTEGDRENRII